MPPLPVSARFRERSICSRRSCRRGSCFRQPRTAQATIIIMMRRVLLAALALGMSLWAGPADSASAAPAEARQLAAYLASLPPAQLPGLSEQQALAMVAMPLSCFDHPQ